MEYRNRIIVFFCVCTIVISSFSCNEPNATVATLMNVPENGLVQVKQGKNRSILLQVLPDIKTQPTAVTGNPEEGLYRIKLTLKTNQKINDYKEMQYINFDIKNSLYAVKGKDTLSCIICERIPGISEKEFLYLAAFDKRTISEGDDWNLRIHIDDEVAGWGMHVFEINHAALQKLNVIKY